MDQPDSDGEPNPPTSINRLSKLRSGVSVFGRNPESDASKWGFKYGGVVIAGIGFVLTRITVLPVVHLDVTLVPFLAGDILPLVLGLGITVIGLGLSISTLPRTYVNTVAMWSLFGTLGMGVVAGVVVLQVALYIGMPPLQGVWASSLFANTLLAGAIGGILIGFQSARNEQHRRDLKQQSSQTTILNRLLRHEVLNKLAVIQGYTSQLVEEPTSSEGTALEQIQRSSTQVRDAVDDVGFLTRLRPDVESSFIPIRIDELLEEQVEATRKEYPEATIAVDGSPSEPIHVLADTHLRRVFNQLLENAVQHSETDTPRIEVSMDTTETYVTVTVADNGPGLPESQRAILRNGTLPSYDDPSTGFGLPLVRMLVSQYDGTIEVDSDRTNSDGTAITVTFPRVEGNARNPSRSSVAASVGSSPRKLGHTALAALVSGVGMGVILYGLTDTLPAIGGLYGVQSFGIGWVLHLFHSVVFGLVFAATVSRSRVARYTTSLGRYTTFGLGYGIVLWAGAAGIVMPVWLNLVGIPASVPFLTLPSLLGHAVWGLSLGALYGYLVP